MKVAEALVDQTFLRFQEAVAGRYSLERELGRGGMGIVYLAREVRLDRLVAIKLLPPALAAQAPLRERFLREARMAARLSHPNIVPIHAVDEAGDFVFYVMAFVNGETLSQRVRTRGPLPPAEAARILREVAWALAYAHAEGVVHRDVKPENILLEAGSGRALVADFGIARLTQSSGGTGVGEVLGTPEFMSPEQAAGEAVDGRTDLYALGVVGYFAFSGRLPFDGGNAAAILAKHLTQAPAPLASVAPAVPRSLAAAVDKCLVKDPDGRFPTGAALAESLGDALSTRQDIPVPIRVFLNRGRVIIAATSYFYAFLIPMLFRISTRVLTAGAPLSQVVLFTLLKTAAFVLPPLYLGRQIRKLIRRGFGPDDLQVALQQRFDLKREEMQFESGSGPTFGEKALRTASVAGLSVAALSSVAIMLGPGGNMLWVSGIAALYGVAFGVAAWMRRRSRVASSPLWGRFWGGKVGRWLFKVSGFGLAPAAPAIANRPTEIAIGLAADALFAALPKPTRAALGDLPETVRRLESQAHAMRKRVEELDGAIGLAGTGPGERAAGEQRAALVADFSKARERAQRRLGEAVAALEAIRLDLLRLTAGAGSVEGLTADLAAAKALGEEADRLVAGREEVERALRRA
ncbi:MAG TPA: serine/threonine-protein kinase [Gemmatimonadales bacterium]|nr:serine/threonine-protein kinase [Gemmatimonadales bacterium]